MKHEWKKVLFEKEIKQTDEESHDWQAWDEHIWAILQDASNSNKWFKRALKNWEKKSWH